MNNSLKLELVFADNVANILGKHQLRPSGFCSLCSKHGIALDKSFLSRVFAYKMNFTISKVNLIASGIALLEPNIKPNELFIPNLLQKKSKESQKAINQGDFRNIIDTVVNDLIGMGWIKIASDIPIKVVNDYATNELKKFFLSIRKHSD